MLSPVEARRARHRIWSSQSQSDRLKMVLGRAEAELEFLFHILLPCLVWSLLTDCFV